MSRTTKSIHAIPRGQIYEGRTNIAPRARSVAGAVVSRKRASVAMRCVRAALRTVVRLDEHRIPCEESEIYQKRNPHTRRSAVCLTLIFEMARGAPKAPKTTMDFFSHRPSAPGPGDCLRGLHLPPMPRRRRSRSPRRAPRTPPASPPRPRRATFPGRPPTPRARTSPNRRTPRAFATPPALRPPSPPRRWTRPRTPPRSSAAPPRWAG